MDSCRDQESSVYPLFLLVGPPEGTSAAWVVVVVEPGSHMTAEVDFGEMGLIAVEVGFDSYGMQIQGDIVEVTGLLGFDIDFALAAAVVAA